MKRGHKTKLEYLIWLKGEGHLDRMYRYNIIGPLVYKSLTARLKVRELITLGAKPYAAAKRVAGMLGVSLSQLYKYLKD